MKINNIWNELELDSSFQSGLLLRRFSASVLPDIFVALKAPQKNRCIAAMISKSIILDISSFDNLKDISVEVFPDEKNKNRNVLLFKLLAPQHKDIFSVLCEDLISIISTQTNEEQVVNTLLNRFEKWKLLFKKITLEGLSLEKQRGLFGEIYFLRKYLLNCNNYQSVLDTWVGPANDVRDFQFNTWALEVKTTQGNNHQRVQISSERQLDTTHLEKLFLYHLSLEKIQGGGESLNQIIESVNVILDSDIIALNRFRSKLYEAGYFEQHLTLYNSIGYFIRQGAFYLVEKEFPRIQEQEIRHGVGDVKYSIIISQCEAYIQAEHSVFETLSIQ